MNIADLLRESAVTCPEQVAILFEGRTYTYGELDRLTDQFAAALRAGGIQTGQVIGLLL